MALTDIARKLKETFPGYDAPGYEDAVAKFAEKYGAAESIHIGTMNYIVINDVYKSDAIAGVPEHISQLFYNSINIKFAIIDAENSATLIDEVYSRVTYMQRDCVENASLPTPEKIIQVFKPLIGSGEVVAGAKVENDDEQGELGAGRANIFQCQLIKDTGVSATPDVYSFLLDRSQMKEISDQALRRIQDTGRVSILDSSNINELKAKEGAIQDAVFKKYLNSDVEIQSVTVKSIFEIKMASCNIVLEMQRNQDGRRKPVNSIFRTIYMKSEGDEFDAVNANIHQCNCCRKDLVDARNETNIHALHTNMDAYDVKATERATESVKGKHRSEFINYVYAVGCEDCLKECEACHMWHFDYEKMDSIDLPEGIRFVEGRSFVQSLHHSSGVNYCACREGIEWVFDEKSGEGAEHEAIPIQDIAFVNSANERLAGYEEYWEYYERAKENHHIQNVEEECELARRTFARFKDYIANKFKMVLGSVEVTTVAKCRECTLCGGTYYELTDGRCAVCSLIFDGNQRMVTRVDGMVFMMHGRRNNQVLDKFVVTRWGNLKRISTKRIIEELEQPGAESPPPEAQESIPEPPPVEDDVSTAV